jgi:hypothetical protein
MRNLHDIERRDVDKQPQRSSEWVTLLVLAMLCGTVLGVVWIIWG